VNYDALSQAQIRDLEEFSGLLQSYLIEESVKSLEEEFYQVVRKDEGRCQILNLKSFNFQKSAGGFEALITPFLVFVEQNFLTEEFSSQNMQPILFDENDMPIWALIFAVFRAGKHKILEQIFRCGIESRRV